MGLFRDPEVGCASHAAGKNLTASKLLWYARKAPVRESFTPKGEPWTIWSGGGLMGLALANLGFGGCCLGAAGTCGPGH